MLVRRLDRFHHRHRSPAIRLLSRWVFGFLDAGFWCGEGERYWMLDAGCGIAAVEDAGE
jgi:hypothetical protein